MDRGSNRGVKAVSMKMAEGWMQLAMEEKNERKGRDVQAIQWLIENLTEDAEMEQFVMAIPGSFSTDWGIEVWQRVSGEDRSDKRSRDDPAIRPLMNMSVSTAQGMPRVSQPSYSGRIHRISRSIVHLVKKLTLHYSPTDVLTHTSVIRSNTAIAHIQGEDAVHKLRKCVTHTLEICRSRQFLTNDDIKNALWWRRTPACIETIASLMFCANTRLDWFGGVEKLLGDIGTSEKPQELSMAGTGQFFMICWMCISLVVVQNFLGKGKMSYDLAGEREMLARKDDTGNDEALTVAQKINMALLKANQCLYLLYREVLCQREDLTEGVIESLRGHESQISELEQIYEEACSLPTDTDLMIYNQQVRLFNYRFH